MNTAETALVKWLKTPARYPAGVTWGMPWKKGMLQRNEQFVLKGSSGELLPLQTRPTAYWPDGSVKWTAHSASVLREESEFQLVKGGTASTEYSLEIAEYDDRIEVHTGPMECILNKSGTDVIRLIRKGTREVCSGGKLIGVREEPSETLGILTKKQEPFQSEVVKVSVEQSGPVRGVIKIEGRHQISASGRKWLPFVLRCYVYAGQESIRIIHSFIYDGNPHKDFIKGLGISFNVKLQGPLYNRHIRFMGEDGVFSESPKNLMTSRTRGKYEDLYQKQFTGEMITLDSDEDSSFLNLLDDSAVWDSFKLIQDSSEHYSIVKRTGAGCSWLHSNEGQRAQGLLYAGSEQGGIAASLRNFWHKNPSSLEAQGMSKDEGTVQIWFWSPDSQAMDLRHYDTETHVQSSYEGFEEMRSTPYGIANTSELSIWFPEKTPDFDTLKSMADANQSPPQLVCEPKYYHAMDAFGIWGLVKRDTPVRAWLEDELDAAVRFYQKEIEQRKWYGFWNYGDFMHSYDPVRHTWRYDIGGFAWQNTELAPNYWLWFMFLRTGREDIFRMAEAMTRHTSEVDVYHIGEYAGLGSRHNVLHWGCGCKEARIAMAGLHRFYYYLTGDERIGDIMDEVKDSDYTTGNLDPMRAYFPKDEFPTHTRVGPDWAAFSSNWMTRWERHEDEFYRDKLKAGIESLKKMPFRLLSGSVFGYDPKTGELHFFGNDNNGRHLAICMGAPQVWMELMPMLEDPVWEEMLIELGAFYNLSREEKSKRTDGEISGKSWDWPMFATGITAYAAVKKKDPQLAQLAWRILIKDHGLEKQNFDRTAVSELEFVRPIQENTGLSTNGVSQWCLNLIVCLDLIEDKLPDHLDELQHFIREE